MSNNQDDPLTKKPSHIAFHVRSGEDGKAYFNRIGSAFAHKDGEGYNVLLDATPVDGKVTLRTPKERTEDMKNGKRSQNRGSNNRGRYDGPEYER